MNFVTNFQKLPSAVALRSQFAKAFDVGDIWPICWFWTDYDEIKF